jgi:hypothetical protein
VAGSTLTPPAVGTEHGQGNDGGSKSDASHNWITVSEAARISGVNKGVISRAADAQEIKTNGKDGRGRRLGAGSFSQWVLQRSPTAEPTNDPEEVIRRAKAARQIRGIADDK